MTKFPDIKVIINGEVFIDVTDITTSDKIMSYEEAEALTNGEVITTG